MSLGLQIQIISLSPRRTNLAAMMEKSCYSYMELYPNYDGFKTIHPRTPDKTKNEYVSDLAAY
jgi:hypothetical protein